LHWAAVRGHPKATEYLIKCDADVNFKNKGELSRPSCHHISVIIKWCKYIICNKNLCLLVPSHIRMSVCARAVCRHPNNAGLLNNMYILSYWRYSQMCLLTYWTGQLDQDTQMHWNILYVYWILNNIYIYIYTHTHTHTHTHLYNIIYAFHNIYNIYK
jgi:hypothetical protein